MDLVALEEIRQVKYRYLRCVDQKLWDELADVFTPDATVDYGTRVYGRPLKLAGRDEIIAFFRANLGPAVITVHAAGQPEIAALRLTRLFTPALAEAKGSVVMINSMVVRFSQRTMGPYKLAKAALLAMAQSLATELGPQGIRVNSVAPGHLWGDSLNWYFGYLGRLPEPDEIADAVVFLSSGMARAITGQCLDVNCGEYHH